MDSPTILITSAVHWAGVTARPQHFARILAERGWNVLFVDGPVTLLGPLKNPSLRSRLLPYPPIAQVPLAKGDGSLRVLSPPAQLPFGNMARSINRANQKALAHFIHATTPGPYVLLANLPGSVDLIRHLHPSFVLYDCVDFHSEFSGFVNPQTVNEMERDLVSVSRCVFTTATSLYERMSELHSHVHQVPNAAEVEHFAKANDAPLHPLLHDIPSTRVGFIGGIGPWIDLDLVLHMAQARPQVQFVMIGPLERDTSRYQAPNIHWLGPQPYSELPQFLSGFEATLVPFHLTELAQAVNPVKTYEYLAAGREVIATPIREMQKLSDAVWLVHDNGEAVSALDRILSKETRLSKSEREELVERHSWDARVDVIEGALRDALPRL